MTMVNTRLSGLCVAALVLAADLWTKFWIMPQIALNGGKIALLPFFDLIPVWNRGVSFGLFAAGSDAQWMALVILASLLAALILYWLWHAESPFVAGACGLILGGAIGNIYDRVKFGAVRDFFDFYIGEWHWPAFNIADASICVGVFLLLLCQAKFAKVTR